MQIIDELERRIAVSMAARWAISAGGDMDHAITIRTLVFRGDEYSFQAGAGIVADQRARNRVRRSSCQSGSMSGDSKW